MNVIELKRLGDRYEELGDYESAELVLRKAIDMQEKELGEEHPSLAADLYNLGLLYQAMEKFSDAETLLLRAWAIERRSFGPMHDQTLATLEALSELHQDANRPMEIGYSLVCGSSARKVQATSGHMYH